MSQKHIGEPFSGVHTSLEDLEAAGWKTRSNGYSWWWELRNDDRSLQARVSVPHWVHQLLRRAEQGGYERGKADVRTAFRETFGVKPPRAKVSDTAPEFPNSEDVRVESFERANQIADGIVQNYAGLRVGDPNQEVMTDQLRMRIARSIHDPKGEIPVNRGGAESVTRESSS